jgi:YHS domain-containing protein
MSAIPFGTIDAETHRSSTEAGARLFIVDRGPMRALIALLAAACALALSGCGTPSATVRTSHGADLMLLGYDPVGYFREGRPVRGRHDIAATHEGRTYYFASDADRREFLGAPSRYEPQYGGFCSNGAAYRVKLGSDPTQFEIRDGRLFVFGDILGHESWLLDEKENIAHADAVWPQIRDKGWREATLEGWILRVPWYKTGARLREEWRAKHPGRPEIRYDTGGLLDNIVFKYPGWRAREGHDQVALGVPGEPDDPQGARR